MPDPTTSSDVILLSPKDNTCVAARDLNKGDEIVVAGTPIHLAADVPIGHKIALARIEKEGPVHKYGQVIGEATERIEPGDWVHSHNLAVSRLALDYAPATQIPPDPEPITGRSFDGYRRADGKSGTRNYVAVISTVNCSASVARRVAERFDTAALAGFPNVDGVVAFSHKSGCGIELDGSIHKTLNRVMGGLARHPNVAACVIIGLGCEQAEGAHLIEREKLVQWDPATGTAGLPPALVMQDCGGTVKTVEAAATRVAELLPHANDVRREPIPAGELILGTECGGSDGNSGITSNAVIGLVSDMLVACGATSILAETTELCGAEHLLTRRARNAAIADRLIQRIKWWEWYAGLFGSIVDDNRSAGNKEGGLTTIAEKSLGAVAKGGTTALEAVYEYAEPVTSKGLVVMDTPGFDPASITGMVAGGANMIVFSTGRGTCYGCKPVPSIKIASNTPMFNRMSDDMDFDAGTILAGRDVRQVAGELLDMILAVASGSPTKSERHGLGEEEFVPWLVGATL